MMEEYAIGGGLGMGFGFIFMLAFWALIFYLIYFLITSNKLNKNTSNSNKSPKDILKKRLAEGEIDKKEFEDLLKEVNK